MKVEVVNPDGGCFELTPEPDGDFRWIVPEDGTVHLGPVVDDPEKVVMIPDAETMKKIYGDIAAVCKPFLEPVGYDDNCAVPPGFYTYPIHDPSETQNWSNPNKEMLRITLLPPPPKKDIDQMTVEDYRRGIDTWWPTRRRDGGWG